MSPFWILLELSTKEVVMTAGAIRRAKLQSNRHHQHTITQRLYRSDALSVALKVPHVSNSRPIYNCDCHGGTIMIKACLVCNVKCSPTVKRFWPFSPAWIFTKLGTEPYCEHNKLCQCCATASHVISCFKCHLWF